MKLIATISIIVLPLFAFSIDSIDSVRYCYAENAPKCTSIGPLVKYLKTGACSESKIVETFFYWIAINIEYNSELKDRVNLSDIHVSIDSVLINKKTICSGYSNLLYEMCKVAKIECIIILGIGQNYIEKQTDSTNHAWNAVLINKKWELIDVTWGSGGANYSSSSYTKKLDIKYLYAEPYFFLIDHFPKDKRWQLINKPITLSEFQGKSWKEMRFRKFNDLLDDNEYKNYIEIIKNNR